jgi:ABC-type multidrug transport system permease subunit
MKRSGTVPRGTTLGLRAAGQVFSHEMVLQVKNRMLFMAIFATVMWVLFLGYFMAAQAQPARDLRVAVAHPGLAAALARSEHLKVLTFADTTSAREAVRRGEVLAALSVLPGDGGQIELLLDDSQAAAARAVQAAVMAALMAAADVPVAEAPGGAALTVREAWGLRMADGAYLMRVLGPGFVPISTLMLAFTSGGFALLAEKTRKTIFLFALSPARRGWLLLGKLTAHTLLQVLVALLMVPVVIYWIGVPLTGSLAALIAAQTLGGVGFLGICYVLSSLPMVNNEISLRMIVGVPLLMPMMLLSGIMYPVPLLPGWLQTVAGYLPMSWMMEAARETFYRGGGFAEIGTELLRLGIFAAAAVVLAIASLVRLLRSQ